MSNAKHTSAIAKLFGLVLMVIIGFARLGGDLLQGCGKVISNADHVKLLSNVDHVMDAHDFVELAAEGESMDYARDDAVYHDTFSVFTPTDKMIVHQAFRLGSHHFNEEEKEQITTFFEQQIKSTTNRKCIYDFYKVCRKMSELDTLDGAIEKAVFMKSMSRVESKEK